jgi:histidinol phosphatase-like enzyme
MGEVEVRPATIFIDLDGTIVKHNYNPQEQMDELLPGSLKLLRRWKAEGHKIILTTARDTRDCRMFLNAMREQLSFTFDDVITGITAGPRFLINDRKHPDADKAIAFNLDRNVGLVGLEEDWKY